MLRPHEPPPFSVVSEDGPGDVLILCDHASPRVPEALADLGVSEQDRRTHIGWDIGALDVARSLAARLGATLFSTGYSRLVVDCNRPLDSATLIPELSGGVHIPGNEGLDAAARAARVEAFHRPYHAAIAAFLDARLARGQRPILLSVHSFTPAPLHGRPRPWPIGLLYDPRAPRLAHAFRDALRAAHPTLLVGDNEPYAVAEGSDYAVPVHGVARGLLHTAFELRQDGVATPEAAEAWAERLAHAHHQAVARVGAA